MGMPVLEPTASIRLHPELSAMFKAAENRHLTPEEFRLYERVMPSFADRAAAAREIVNFEQAIVDKVVTEIFLYYRFEGRHAHARTKTVRDMVSVSAYATLSMLMNDPHWFRDKLLLWLRTILQALDFPDRDIEKRKSLFKAPGEIDLSELQPNQRAIYESYQKMKALYKEKLTPASFALFELYLQQAADTLSGS